VANWIGAVASALGLKKKVKPTSFHQENGQAPFNASGVAEVGRGRFVFIDNHDPSALFELALDSDGAKVERISRRPLAGVADGELRDPEGLTRVDVDGQVLLIVASSLCVLGGDGSGRREVCEGLVRIRFTPHGDLRAEGMPGFRDWLLGNVPSLAAAARRAPDAGGLNVEGLAWETDTRTLLFGLRGPTDAGIVTVIRVPVAPSTARWTTDALGAPSTVRIRLPRSKAMQGIRDISYDEHTGYFLILVGRSTSTADEPFQLCAWDGSSDAADLLDVKFHRSMKPEGLVAFSSGGRRMLLIVDDRGGYAVVGYPERVQ
jgi:hypothetical protein